MLGSLTGLARPEHRRGERRGVDSVGHVLRLEVDPTLFLVDRAALALPQGGLAVDVVGRVYLNRRGRLFSTVSRPFRTVFRGLAATLRIPGVKTEKTAKKRRKTEQKWARYGLRKRVRAAVL